MSIKLNKKVHYTSRISFSESVYGCENATRYKDVSKRRDEVPLHLKEEVKVPKYVISGTHEHCTVDGFGTYMVGAVVELKVIPDDGYEFLKWSDGNTDNPRSITVEEDITLDVTCKEVSYLCFTAQKDSCSIKLSKIGEPTQNEFETSSNGRVWNDYTIGDEIVLNHVGDKVYFRNTSEITKEFSKSPTQKYYFEFSDLTSASGDITSLLRKSGKVDTIPNEYCYYGMFEDCTSLTAAPELPATTLASNCYSYMFTGCTSLTVAPELPATTLASNCYSHMFTGCTSLTAAPELPATTLADSCYLFMFGRCTSLAVAPELPATTLANYCYSDMFFDCTSLVTAPELPATTLADYCYSDMFYGCTSLATAPELPATTLAKNCCYAMFQDCTSLTTVPSVLLATTLTNGCYGRMFSGCTSLVTAPELPATTLAKECYREMFYGCTSLTAAPELPATTLVLSAYTSMFRGCTSLNYVKCLAASSTQYTSYMWLVQVSSTGRFLCKDESNFDYRGGIYGGIPSGWSVEIV